jgi:hypothetical protein
VRTFDEAAAVVVFEVAALVEVAVVVVVFAALAVVATVAGEELAAAWYPSTPTKPSAVVERTMGARCMSETPLSVDSEGERFVMDALVGDA